MDLLSIAWALARACVFAVPIGLTLWALLDAARRPAWAWALADRRQVVWMALILFSGLTVVGGLLVAGYYLTGVRHELAAAESGVA